MVGRWEGAGKLPVPGRPTNLDYSRARAFVHSYRLPWEVPHLIHCAMLMTFKFYIQIHNYTITPSYRLRFVNGTNSRLRLVIRLVLIYLKRESTTTLAYHLLITSQARDLAKFIMPDLELNVAPCVITCFRKIL